MRRTLLSLILVSVSLAAAHAQTDYPARPVRIIVPSAPGGGTDISARLIAQQLSKTLGQQFYVENRAGAGQMIGIETVAHAAPNGYSLLMAASTLAINPVMYKKVNYDVLRDLAPITLVASLPNILVVNASLPIRSVSDLIAAAKQNPGQLTYASAGIGTSPHMSMELFKSMSHTDILHLPYKGTTPGVTDLIAGTVNIMMANILTVRPHIESGSLRALGVTGLKRLPAMPELPTIAEAGVLQYEVLNWYGFLAPAGTPPVIIDRLQAEIAAALKIPEIRERLVAAGAEPVGDKPAAFSARIKADLEKWAATARSANITPQ
jgi:tripartite-type tricarboxylate transporter receptor subunit TctC